ncbi:hypothetical protein [Bradyrhizobium sp. ARR65]|uniref:hypothetical protein n=1 Tax=Bradyrhizobium sp. ARR65 TaxID=1040989 RepID=UPI000A7422C6|nr:hypothetical protein [Bradyrhizobium sp. ARR65]
MNKAILIGAAILTVSTSAASAWTHQSHRNGYQTHHSSAYRATRAAPREAMNNSAYNNGYYGPGYARSGFWPADVAGAAVGTAGAIATGAVNTAGAIATAPFRPANPYAYYPGNSYAYYGVNSYGVAPGVSSKDHEMYVKNLHASGYNPKSDFTASGTMRSQ